MNNHTTSDRGLVSIVMPAYNSERYLGEAISSVLNQTYTNWELIIVDDCSTDSTPSILSDFYARHPERLKVIKQLKNAGPAAARNTAIRAAQGKWIAFLDSDDVWLPKKLERQIAFMQERNISFSYTDYEHIDASGRPTNTKVTGPSRITKIAFFRYCWVGCLTVMYDAENIGLIQIPPIKNRDDYALWLRICKKANCYRIPEVLALYRKGHGTTQSSGGFARLIKYHYQMFRVSEGMGIAGASFATIRNLLFGAYKKLRYVRKY